MPDAPAANAEAPLSPEVADMFGETTKAATPKQEAPTSTPSEKPDDKKTPPPEEPGKPPAEAPPEKKEEEPKKPEGEDDSKKDEDAQPKDLTVGGKKYSSFEEAVGAMTKMAGENSRLTGDWRIASKERDELSTKLKEAEQLLTQYREANQQWQKFYETGEDKPDDTKVNLEEQIDKMIDKREQKREEEKRRTQYNTELDEIFASPDIADILPTFKQLIEEHDGSPKVSPKILAERARKLMREDKTKDSASIDEEVKKRVDRELAKRAASKVSGASGSSSASKPDEELSPEIRDLYRN